MAELKQDFLQGMSFAAATVNVVTTDGPAGRSGVTVSAMSSVSADTERPTLLVCVNDSSSGAAPIVENGVFCVNILRDDQAFVSDTFAGRYGDKGEAKFGCGEWVTGPTGAPMLANALVAFDCRLTRDIVVGTHHVFFGEAEEIRVAESGAPLIYANRGYGTPLRLPQSAVGKPADEGAVKPLRLACLNSFAPYFLPDLLAALQQAVPHLAVEVIEGDQAQVLGAIAGQDAELALCYDRQLPDTVQCTPLANLRPYVLLPAGHRLAASRSVRLADLAEEPLILLDAPLSRDYFLSLFEAQGIVPNVGVRTSSFELVRSLVASGAGYAVLVTRPASMTSYDGKPLTACAIADEIAGIGLGLISRGTAVTGPDTAMVIAECQRFFAERLPA